MGKLFYGLILLAIGVTASATVPAAIEADLKAGMPLPEAVERARENGWQPVQVLRALTAADVDLVKAVQTISREWHDCEATYAVAGAGTRMAPLRADEIAASIATLRNCQCDARSLWAKTRINRRLRPEIHRVLVKVGDVCSCAAAGIEAAVEAAPQQAENVIEAVITAKNAPDNTADSFGEVGALPDPGYWVSDQDPMVRSRDSNLVRKPDWCRGDTNERDDFVPAEQWLAVPLDDLDSLGQHQAQCRKEENSGPAKAPEDKQQETGRGLIFSQYYEGPGHNQALEFYNPTDEAIRFSDDPYDAEIYFHGYAVPGEVLRLKGVVPAHSTFVVANALADNPGLKAKANQLVFGLNFAGADAVVLKNRLNWNNCDCAITSVAASLRAGSRSDKTQAENAPLENTWLTRLKQHYAHGETPALVVDSAGELPVDARSEPSASDNSAPDSAKIPPPLRQGTWQRKPVVCFGDRLELDPFVPAEQWQVTPRPQYGDLGQHRLDACPETPQELLLSEMVIGENNNQAVEIFNATPEPIDFSRDRYVLEIYRDDNLQPDRVIGLAGQIATGAAFVVANQDADEAVLEKASQRVKGLNLNASYSVVLRRVVAPAYQACFAEVADWLRKDPDPQYLSYIPVLVVDPFVGPQSGDDPRDGDHGGDLASPN